MSDSKVAVTLYTLRDFTKTPPEIADTLRRVKAIGYDNIQLSAMGPIEPRELRRMADGEGLNICATHVDYNRLLHDLSAVVDEHRLWDCSQVAIGSVPTAYRNGEGYRQFAVETRQLTRDLAKEGLTFSYHNHNWELERHDGRTGLDIMVEECDSAVCFEIDTYWIQAGGGDPAAWIRKVNTRIPLLHLKDMGVSDRKPIMTEIGEGNLNWPAILDAAREAGVEWYIGEQDWCARDPFESIAISLRNQKAMGLT